ncbi:uncharacterized protein LOC123554849 [Mercenaria mercenaria]|uniref:uncharacterized protein LOC123554849 n=1 Tax=Mercenaria mercenaria TaxID=6596 RepID=UPI00234E4387|nr:uncharacterized protein LOC123554849 [Mercenaria mercenaria]
MDFLRIFISCIAIICLPRVAEAGCAQDVGKSQGFTQCVMGYSMFMSNAASSMDPNDPNAMMTIMCSKEGKAAMKCVLDYVKTCPDLMTSGDTAVMLKSLEAFDQFGGLEGYCNSMSGPCTAVQQCLSSQRMEDDNSPMPSQPSPFSIILTAVKMICGPVKGMFDCFKDVGDQCKDLENNIKNMMDVSRSNAPEGYPSPTYDQAKSFAMNECPKLPSDFSTNTCVKNTVSTDEFLNCYANVTVNYPDSDVETSCDAYRAGHKCISMTVGKKCGAKYTNAFVKVTPLFLKTVPSNCKLESTTSSSSLVQMSSFAAFAALALAFKLM